MKLYLATLEITRGIVAAEMETETIKIGIFNDLNLAIENATKEFDKYIITDTQVQEVKKVWDKYKKHVQGYLYMIPEENEEVFYSELDNLGIRKIYEDPQELLGANICINVASYNINEPMPGTTVYTQSRKNAEDIHW